MSSFDFCHRYDDVIIDYRINVLIPITFFVDVMLTSISLVTSQLLGFVTVIVTSVSFAVLTFILCFSDCCFVMFSYRRVDPGVQSGNKTQIFYSEGDVRVSDADNLEFQPVAG